VNMKEDISTFPLPFKKAEMHDVEAAEIRLGITFAPDYRLYLLGFNTFKIKEGKLTCLHADKPRYNVVEATLEARSSKGIPNNLYVVSNPHGSSLLLEDSNGKIYFWKEGKIETSYPGLIDYEIAT
jgi:hypothetical protein